LAPHVTAPDRRGHPLLALLFRRPAPPWPDAGPDGGRMALDLRLARGRDAQRAGQREPVGCHARRPPAVQGLSVLLAAAGVVRPGRAVAGAGGAADRAPGPVRPRAAAVDPRVRPGAARLAGAAAGRHPRTRQIHLTPWTCSASTSAAPTSRRPTP